MTKIMWIFLILMAALAACIWLFGPREEARLLPAKVHLPNDLDKWLASREAGIRQDLAARIVWAGPEGEKSDLAIVYLHGFSASPRELQPLPQQVAAAVGANLFITRLTGHGQDGAALGRARLADWWRDTAEAVAVGQRLGRRVIIIGTSTGATLAAEAARDPLLGPKMDGVVSISGNFGLRARGASLLGWPFARRWVPLIVGQTRCFEPINPEHAAAWTECYPSVATLPMAALVRHARMGTYDAAAQAALFIWADGDQVVDPAAAMRIADIWAGPVTRQTVNPGPGDDPAQHVIAGEILSPGMNAPVTTIITNWIAREFR